MLRVNWGDDWVPICLFITAGNHVMAHLYRVKNAHDGAARNEVDWAPGLL